MSDEEHEDLSTTHPTRGLPYLTHWGFCSVCDRERLLYMDGATSRWKCGAHLAISDRVLVLHDSQLAPRD